MNLGYSTGRPWAREPLMDSVVSIPSTVINAETVGGSRRLPSLTLVDVRAQKTFGKATFRVFADDSQPSE